MIGAFHWFPPLMVVLSALLMLALGWRTFHGGHPH